MKANYKKPTVEFEEYQLNTPIAWGCTVKVSLGTADMTHTACPEYESAFGEDLNGSVQNFWPESCSCYLTAGVEPVFTS